MSLEKLLKKYASDEFESFRNGTKDEKDGVETGGKKKYRMTLLPLV